MDYIQFMKFTICADIALEFNCIYRLASTPLTQIRLYYFTYYSMNLINGLNF